MWYDIAYGAVAIVILNGAPVLPANMLTAVFEPASIGFRVSLTIWKNTTVLSPGPNDIGPVSF